MMDIRNIDDALTDIRTACSDAHDFLKSCDEEGLWSTGETGDTVMMDFNDADQLFDGLEALERLHDKIRGEL